MHCVNYMQNFAAVDVAGVGEVGLLGDAEPAEAVALHDAAQGIGLGAEDLAQEVVEVAEGRAPWAGRTLTHLAR